MSAEMHPPAAPRGNRPPPARLAATILALASLIAAAYVRVRRVRRPRRRVPFPIPPIAPVTETLAPARPSRGWLALLAARVALVVVLLAALVVVFQRSRPAAGVWVGPPPSAPLAGIKSLGVNADLSRYGAADREPALAAMEAAGLSWLRLRFPWDAIEPQRGRLDWARWDSLVESAAGHDLQVIAVLDGAPAWARAEEDATNPLAPPSDPADFGAFASALAARYAGQIDYYQVWDEPNIAPHWGAREIDPAGYARLLREGAVQIRSADPAAVILLAALAPNVEPGGANMSELAFLDALYGSDAGQWFDVAAVQLYPFDDAPDAAPDAGRLNWKRAALLRRVMEDHGDVEAAVWAVRFGWPGPQTEALPPAALASAVEQARQDWPWLGLMLWAAWSPADLHPEYALVDAAGGPGAMLSALREVANQPAIAWPGAYPPDHLSGHYSGRWRVVTQGADIGDSGDSLAIRFWGSRLDLAVRRGDYRAFLYVTVDGLPASALPRDTGGRAYVVLYDPLSQPATVTLAQDLPPGEHVATIVADRGWGQWAVAGWTVSRQGKSMALPAAFAAATLLWLAIVVAQAAEERAWLVHTAGALLARYRALDDRLTLGVTAAALGLAIAAQNTALSLLALGLLSIALFLHPATGLPLIVLALPFYQPGKPLLGKVFSFVEILTVLTAITWGANRLLKALSFRRPAARTAHLTGLDWAVLSLVAWSLLSLLWAGHGREAAREFRTVILEAGLFYGLLRVMVRGHRDVWRLVDAWVLGAVAVAVLGIGQWLLGQNVITADGVWRVRGFYGSPNNLALFLGRVLPMALAVAAFGRLAVGRIRRWAYGLGAAAMVAALFLTYSRAAWLIGVPAALLFLIILAAGGRKRRMTLIAVGLALLIVALVATVLVGGVGRLASLLDSSQGTTYFRLQLWQSSLAMLRDHPLLGVGLDNFLYAYRTRYVLPTAWEEFNLSHPHNLVLDFWLRLGLPGLALLVWMLVAFFRRGWRLYGRLPARRDRLLALGLMAGMVNFVAHGMVDASFFLVDLGFVFMLMLALVQVPPEAGQGLSLPVSGAAAAATASKHS